MASINISEDDFMAVALAAGRAEDEGDMVAAYALDKIARKINAALTGAIPERKIAQAMSGASSTIRWQDMPSTLRINNPDWNN
jgi:hypothetical protein